MKLNTIKNPLLFILIIILSSCSKEELRSSNSITNFVVEHESIEYKADINDIRNEIILSIPFNIDLSSLNPIIKLSQGASISPESKAISDYTNPIKLSIIAENGSVRIYTIKVNKLPNIENFIISFKVPNDGDYLNSTIDNENNIIAIEVPFRYNLTDVYPEIEISENATIFPVNESITNLGNDKILTVTSESGEERKYSVVITRALNDENSILEFKILNGLEYIIGFIDEESSSILIEVPKTLDLKSLTVSISFSENANVSPKLGMSVNISDEFEFIVTAENGLKKTYIVNSYSENLLTNPTGDNNGENWNFDGLSGVEIDNEFGNVFYLVANKGDFSPNINQRIDLSRDYSNKYILFIGDLTTEKIMPNSITRHPYIWAYQIGDFSEDDWVFMQDMIHLSGAN